MSSEVLQEELEVLESIYPTELTKLSEREILIDVEPEEVVEGETEITLSLKLLYSEAYPDSLPLLSLENVDGELSESESISLIDELKTVGSENLGMAMTFSLVSHLREQLSSLVRLRADKRKREEQDKIRIALEEEEARTRGTPVTIDSFKAWKAAFDKEMARKKAKDEGDRLKNLTGKEREEWKKIGARFTGRQLFEKDQNLATSDLSLVEEGSVSVDASQYERAKFEDVEDEEEHLSFSDSD